MPTPTTTFISREVSTQFQNITYSNKRVAHLAEHCACIPKVVTFRDEAYFSTSMH